MAREGLVPVSFGYNEITLDDLKYYMKTDDVESQEFKENLLQDMSYVCTFGLENSLRPHVQDDVSLIKYGHKASNEQNEGGEDQTGGSKKDKARKINMVNVRMITGDHFETARYVARKAGIINDKEFDAKQVVMTG